MPVKRHWDSFGDDQQTQTAYQHLDFDLPTVIEPRIQLSGPNNSGHFQPSKRRRDFTEEDVSSQKTDTSDTEQELEENEISVQAQESIQLPALSLGVHHEKVVCYGMIHRANTKLLAATHAPKIEIRDDLSIANLQELQLDFKDQAVFLGSSASESVAVMTSEISKVLHDLSSLSSCRFKAFLSSERTGSLPGESSKLGQSPYQPVDIIIYGPQSIRKSVGRILSSARCYLQHPSHKDHNIEYDNPHVFRLEDLRIDSRSLGDSIVRTLDPVRRDRVDSNNFDDEFSDIAPNRHSDYQERVSGVIDSLTRYKYLKRLKADVKITTKLLAHQEQGLEFMRQREDEVPAEYSLWDVVEHERQPVFEHVITGMRTPIEPTENVGGILADDMGLGKTLTVLSTIIRTLELATSFADTHNQPNPTPGLEGTKNAFHFSRATLIVVPSRILIDGWINEIELHCNGSLNVNIYHGRGREVDAKALADWDIVLTTYHTIAAEALDADSPLHKISWFRIVLDEAHIIRRMTTKLFQSVSKLPSAKRWCLTGTPIQNSLQDLSSLVAFVKSAPLDEPLQFQKNIVLPLLRHAEEAENNLRKLLDSICLRRTKTILKLPSVQEEDHIVEFSTLEMSFYLETQAKMVAIMKQHDSHSRNSKNYFGIFQLTLQLRRLCNHGTFQKLWSKSMDADAQFDSEEALEFLQAMKLATCTYCSIRIDTLADATEPSTGTLTVCGHLFCPGCLLRYKSSLQSTDLGFQCPECPQKLPKDWIADPSAKPYQRAKQSSIKSHLIDGSTVSSKVSTLIQDIKSSKSEGKSIVFSSWTRSLDVVADHLDAHQLKFARIDGSNTLSQRQKILVNFDNDPEIQILLMTTGTGAVGHNLTVANRVYLLEPQWNPMVERQAISRVDRLGQKRDVKVVRYIVKDTLEEGMRTQQTKKLGFAKWINETSRLQVEEQAK